MVIPITFQEIRLKVHFFRHFHAFSHNFKLIFYSFSLSISFASGNNYSVAVDIENLGTKSTCTSVALLDENGNDVTEIFVSRMYLIEIARYIGTNICLSFYQGCLTLLVYQKISIYARQIELL